MDAFSVFSSAISVLDIAIRASKALHSLYTELAEAPELILALSNETADISVVLSRVSEARKTLDRLDTWQNAAFLKALDGHILTAKSILSRLGILVTKLHSQAGSIKRIKWCLRKNKAFTLKDELRAIRGRINEILIAHNITISARVELELHRVHTSIHQNHINMLSQIANSHIPAIYAIDKQPENLTTRYHGQEEIGVDMVQPTCESTGTSYQNSILSRDETSQRITAIETTLSSLLAEVSTLSLPYKKPATIHHRDGIRLRTMSRSPSGTEGTIVYFALRSIMYGCASDCPCSCHRPIPLDASWVLPRVFKGLIGSLFVGYTGFPVGRLACNANSCSNAPMIKLQVTYAFPIWFLHYTLHAFLIASTSGALTVSLKVRPRMEFTRGSVLMLVESENEKALRIKLEMDRSLVLATDITHGRSLLQLAFNNFAPNVEIIKMLLQIGADPDYEDDYGRSPRRMLAKAVLCNSFHNIPELVAELNAFLPIEQSIDALGLTYIHKVACGVYPISLMSALEKLGPRKARELIDEPCAEGLTALHLATLRRNTATIRTLILAGANVNAQDILGFTPLLLSVFYGYEDCVDVLLRAGGDVSQTNYVGANALHLAASQSSLDIVKKLVSAGLDLNQPGAFGDTAIGRAARNNLTEMVRYLHQQGAKLNLIDANWDTPLSYSIYHQTQDKGHESFALLLELGADHLVVNKFGNTLLHMIAMAGNIETMKIVAEKKLNGLNVYTKNKEGHTPLEVFEQRDEISDELKIAFDRLLQSVEPTVELAGKYDPGEKVGLNMKEDLDEERDIFEDALENLDDEN